MKFTPYTLEARRYHPEGPIYLAGTVVRADLPLGTDLCGYIPLGQLLPWAKSLGYRVRLKEFSRRRGGPLMGVSFYGDEALTDLQARRLRRLKPPTRSLRS